MSLDQESILTILLQLEKQIIDPNISRDFLVATIADDFVEFGSSGKIYNKNSVIEALLTMPNAKTEIIDFKISFISNVSVLATYKTTRTSDTVTTFALRSSIWKITENNWQIIFHQGTICAELNI